MTQDAWSGSDERALAKALNSVKQLQAKKSTKSKTSYADQLAAIRAEQRLKAAKRKEDEEAKAKADRKAVADEKLAIATAQRVKDHAAKKKAYAKAPRLKINGRRGGVQVIPSGVESGRIGKEFPKTENVRSRGFPAGQNRCYRNSVLQCVLHTPEFYHLLGNIHKDCIYETHKCVTCALQLMAKTYWDGQGGREELEDRSWELGEAMKEVFQDAKDREVVNLGQSDPFDLMTNFARYISRDVTGSDPQYFNDPPIKHAEVNSNNFTVESVFNFDLALSWTCDVCGDVKPPKTETPFGLSIGMYGTREGDRIEDYLSSDDASPFVDIGRFTCESEACIALASQPGYVTPEQVKIRYIREAPEILVARLNRAIDPDYPVTEKVIYEEYLDLSALSLSGEKIEYKLRGIVDHVGSTKFGHYTAEVLCRPTWEDAVPLYCRLDESAVGRRTGDIMDLLEPENTDVYVLVYSRVRDEQ